MNLKHQISPVPAPLWGKNMRKIMTQTEWKKLRVSIIEERGMRCETCQKELTESKQVKAHEDWEYDVSATPAVARLTKIQLSCWHCHAIEHFGGVTNMVGGGELSPQAISDTIAHFCELNTATEADFKKHYGEVMAQWNAMNKLDWVIDWGIFAGWVADNYEGDPFSSGRKPK
jgi:hypothetical protein